jgi:hypothetical protein
MTGIIICNPDRSRRLGFIQFHHDLLVCPRWWASKRYEASHAIRIAMMPM